MFTISPVNTIKLTVESIPLLRAFKKFGCSPMFVPVWAP
jgi:hypothetical protein